MARQERRLARDPEAEAAVLGTIVHSRDAARYATERLTPRDFVLGDSLSSSFAARLFTAVETAVVEETLLGNEALAVALEVRPAEIEDLGASVSWPVFKAAVAKVATQALRRRVAWTGDRLIERAADNQIDIEETVGQAQAYLAGLRLATPRGPSPDVLDFAADVYPYDWLVDGFLERGDRVIVTGIEGLGKTVFLRQLAVQVALGVHPYDGRSVEPRRVLIIDCENSAAQMARELRRLLIDPPAPGSRLLPGMARLESQPQGIDLLTRAGQRWLESTVGASGPELVVIGPLYKLFVGDPRSEAEARSVADTFDAIRKRYGCALLIEAHSPHGDMGDRANWRPFGASLWLRWPEIGIGLAKSKEADYQGRPLTDVREWRMARDRDRRWPRRLRQGVYWPWEVES